MADLNPLIRVRKHAIEQKQKVLAGLFRKAEDLAAQKVSFLDQLETERRKIGEMGPEMAAFFGPYAESVKMRVAGIDAETAKLEVRIQAAQDDMREAFAELKQIEIVQERRDEEEMQEILRKENAVLDDIGIEGFVRKDDD